MPARGALHPAQRHHLPRPSSLAVRPPSAGRSLRSWFEDHQHEYRHYQRRRAVVGDEGPRVVQQRAEPRACAQRSWRQARPRGDAPALAAVHRPRPALAQRRTAPSTPGSTPRRSSGASKWTSHTPNASNSSAPTATSTTPMRVSLSRSAISEGRSRRRATSNATPASVRPATNSIAPRRWKNSARSSTFASPRLAGQTLVLRRVCPPYT